MADRCEVSEARRRSLSAVDPIATTLLQRRGMTLSANFGLMRCSKVEWKDLLLAPHIHSHVSGGAVNGINSGPNAIIHCTPSQT
jgi:hypothetical protein